MILTQRFRNWTPRKRGLWMTLVALGLAVTVYLFSGAAPIESWVASQLLSLCAGVGFSQELSLTYLNNLLFLEI